MKIFCIGRNYTEHAKELGNAVPEEPVIFIKPKTALIQGNTPFYYPQFSNELHYELELVLQICKNGKYIAEHNAHKYYNQITVGIDFTARDIQNQLKQKGLPWEKAKAWDNSAFVGRWKDISQVNQPINFSMNLNGTQVQKGISSDMIYSFNQIVAHISEYFSLNIGDMIFTGTPAGVGECVVSDVLEGFLEKEKLFTVEIK
ncbi:MAG: fumarylacetoacetate hydrolase family protein [Chitinophagaceae bacterium]|nr:fumarylacetoacetate hydrolase family protein [Chitinophagaceae bacterium]